MQGLAYSCAPSGRSGATDANGQFDFVDGDTCSFRIGNITLPPVAAAVVITPREIAEALAASVEGTADAQEIGQNLFQFFQSLDSDGDPGNGITLPDDISDVAFEESGAEALFNVTPVEFQDKVSAAVSQVVETLGEGAGTVAVVSAEAALQHAAEQTRRLISGTWVFPGGEGSLLGTSVTFLPNGTYLLSELSSDGCGPDGFGGVEYAQYSYDALTGEFMVTSVLSDSNGDCGLSGLDQPGLARFRVLGDDLILDALDTDDLDNTEFDGSGENRCVAEAGTVVPTGTGVGEAGYTIEGETYVCRYFLTRAKGTQSLLAASPPPGGLEGSFLLESDLVLGIVSVLTIERTGTNAYRYLLSESYGGNNAPDSEGATDGTARGTFTHDAVTGRITVTEALNTIDGDGGLSNVNEQGTKRLNLLVDEDGNLALTEYRDVEGEETLDFEATLVRLPVQPRRSTGVFAGSYVIAEFDGDVELPQSAAGPAVLNFLDTGEFLFGTYHDDPTCEVSGDKPNGDGIEFGTYTVDVLTGAAEFLTPLAPAFKRFADTNGECGLIHKNGVSDRLFMHPLEDGDGEGILLVYVDDSGEDAAQDLEDVLLQAAAIRSIADAQAYAAGAVADDRGFAVLRPVVSQATAGINGGLNGSWKLTRSTNLDDSVETSIVPLVVTILDDTFFLSQGTITEGAAAIDGIEMGTFSIDADPAGDSFCLETVSVDTATDGGLADGASVEQRCTGTIAISADLRSFTMTFEPDVEGEDNEVLTFTRISAPYAPAI